MARRRSLLNVGTAISFKILLFVGSFLTRRCLIQFVGNDVNGLNALYISIIGVLSVADLGIGDAIIFCMYKPIVKNEIDKVAAFYNLFKRIYTVTGIVIAVAGCLSMPFLPYLAKGYESVNVNLYVTFGLMLISTVLTYWFNAKTALINAYRDNYIATTIASSGQVLQQILQIVVLFLTRSFIWYLLCRIVAVSIQWIATNIVTKKKYKLIFERKKAVVNEDAKSDIIKNVKAVFMHRIGGILVNTVDSLIISAFIGVAVLGKYSNYTTIMTSTTGIIILLFTSLTSTIGHLFVRDKELFRKYYDILYYSNFLIGCVFFLGYYAIIDDLIALLFGTQLILSKTTSFVITLNYFIQFMRQATLTFRDASGTFYYDRWKPLAEGGVNLVLSIAFVMLTQKTMGDEVAVVGVIIATIITNLVICHVVEPHVLYKYALACSVKKHYIRLYSHIALFIVLLVILDWCMVVNTSRIAELITNGCIAVGLSLFPILSVIIINKDFRLFIIKMVIKRS